VGFYKPHMPLHVHQQFWGLFNIWNTSDVAQPTGPQPQASLLDDFVYDHEVVPMDYHMSKYDPWSAPFAPDTRLIVRTGYMAAVAQTDHFFGLLLGKLDALQLSSSTLVVVVGDNGYHLGENGIFGKDNLYEQATHVPLLMRVPWLAHTSPGALRFPGQVELLSVGREAPPLTPPRERRDLYRTVAGLTGNVGAVDPFVSGRDFSHLVQQQFAAPPSFSSWADSATPAFSQVMCACPLAPGAKPADACPRAAAASRARTATPPRAGRSRRWATRCARPSSATCCGCP
jgi:hypothetical protein